MMRFLLSLIICVLAFIDIFGIGLSLGPGLSAKNLLLYMGAGWLLVQYALGRTFKGELQSIPLCPVVLVAYAVITMFDGSAIMHYPCYELSVIAISLKVFFFKQKTAYEIGQ